MRFPIGMCAAAILMLAASGLTAVEPAGGVLNGAAKPRVIVSTDIGGSDPDDFQSMVHLLVYLDLLDVEGLVSSPPGAGRATHILEVIDAYEKDYAKLSSWAAYPTPNALRGITKQGAIDIQASSTPSTSISVGAQHIIDRAKAADSRPLYVLVWGSITDVAQAVHKDPSIKAKLRVYAISSWNTRQDPNAMAYLLANHVRQPSNALWMIESETTFRGMYVWGNQSGDLGNLTFTEQHVKGHGALGALYMAKKKDIKMGDTPTLMHLFTGDPSDPTGESWGGQYRRDSRGANYWIDRTDYAISGYNGAGTVAKWREHYLRHWQGRMDRAQAEKPASGNQAPSVSLTAPAGGTIYTAPASITLSASASDADGSIARVEFFAGTTKIGEDSTAPYGVTWSGVAAGSYSLTARAIDDLGAARSSIAVAITVSEPSSGSDVVGGLASRFQKATLAVGSPVYTDRTFTVTSVGAYGGAQQIRTPNGDKAASVASGYLTFTLGAAADVLVAYDSRASGLPAWLGTFTSTGESLTTSDVAFRLYRRSYAAGATVDLGGNLASGASGAGSNYWLIVRPAAVPAPNQAPSVALTAPSAGAAYTALATIALSASASDADGVIAKVEFFAGATKIGEDATAPYAVSWSGVSAGSYSLTARASDDDGAVTTSAAIAVTVASTPVPGSLIAVNFQPAGAPSVAGYLPDSGGVYASRNGQTYGWNVLNDTTRDRNLLSDQRLDTLIHAQKTSGLRWELAVPAGTYEVTLVCGDAGYTDHVNAFAVEGMVLADPDGQDAFDTYTVTVTVVDGRLTIAPAAGAMNAKLNYVEVVPAPSGGG